MREVLDFNDGWLFEGTPVRLPHTAVELPFNYFDETCYQRPFSYEKRFEFRREWEDREAVLHFEAAMADARVFLNGAELAAHSDGYTPFEVRLTGRATPGQNLLRVEIDGSENPEIPPFGGPIDYLTYAGLYREAWLRLTPPLAIAACKIETPDPLADRKTVTVAVEIANPRGLGVSGRLTATLRDASGTDLAGAAAEVSAERVSLRLERLAGIALWDLDAPALYTLELRLETPHGTDSLTERFGFREARFTARGFVLNGRPLKIRGLNRHQSFPHAGYALGRAAQARDAEILKTELRVNLVRTSHYPQSRHFLDRCDELGLMVFEEIPGWQHIGGAAWKARAVRNVEAMIRRDWNRPSVVLWGVRINESEDDHAFYAETNRLAHALDPTRATGGVRCIAGSELLEDVYTMNDFALGEHELGGNRPRTALRPERDCTGLDRDVPYLVTEFNGHMFPTKPTDPEERQAEHVLRHLEVLDAAYGAGGIAGAIGWCAFDYNTHADFGAGDRICYHGVMDMYREPKFAAHVYASQGDPAGGVVLEPVTLWARGERNIHGVLPLIVLTNCDEVVFRPDGGETVRIAPDRARFANLPHPPVIATAAHFGEDGFGGWGQAWKGVEFDGCLGGRTAITRRFVADPVPTRLEVAPDALRIAPGDDLRVMIRALDQAGNRLRHLADPVTLALSGPARLFGPALVPMRAGSAGLWLRALESGTIGLSVGHGRLGSRSVEIAVA